MRYGLEGMSGNRLVERLEAGPVICAEGYLFECERRGYLQAGAFVPEVVLEHPEVIAQLHREFAHAGSDVVEAFTYYAHREKLRLIGREDDLEPLNRQALAIAGEVARETGALLAGNVSNTNVFLPEESARRDVDEEIAVLPDDADFESFVGGLRRAKGRATTALRRGSPVAAGVPYPGRRGWADGVRESHSLILKLRTRAGAAAEGPGSTGIAHRPDAVVHRNAVSQRGALARDRGQTIRPRPSTDRTAEAHHAECRGRPQRLSGATGQPAGAAGRKPVWTNEHPHQ